MYSNVINRFLVKFEFEKDALFNCMHCMGSEEAMGKISPKIVIFLGPRMNSSISRSQNSSQLTCL